MRFWGGKPATVAGMLLRDDSDNLSQAEQADILAQLPSLDGMNITSLEENSIFLEKDGNKYRINYNQQ